MTMDEVASQLDRYQMKVGNLPDFLVFSPARMRWYLDQFVHAPDKWGLKYYNGIEIRNLKDIPKNANYLEID